MKKCGLVIRVSTTAQAEKEEGSLALILSITTQF